LILSSRYALEGTCAVGGFDIFTRVDLEDALTFVGCVGRADHGSEDEERLDLHGCCYCGFL